MPCTVFAGSAVAYAVSALSPVIARIRFNFVRPAAATMSYIIYFPVSHPSRSPLFHPLPPLFATRLTAEFSTASDRWQKLAVKNHAEACCTARCRPPSCRWVLGRVWLGHSSFFYLLRSVRYPFHLQLLDDLFPLRVVTARVTGDIAKCWPNAADVCHKTFISFALSPVRSSLIQRFAA